MNPYIKIFLVLMFVQLSISQSYAQNLGQNYTITTPILTDEDKIKQVYGNHFFDNKPELKNFFLHLLQNRIQIVSMLQEPSEKYAHLSNVPLLNKINPNLTLDMAYDSNTFNPLKYQMNFYSKATMIYRIDSEYIIVISPQN